MKAKIKSIKAREILSAGAFPTIETIITLESGISGRASVPFGSSAGKYEALKLLDGDPKRYMGLGMLTAVSNVNEKIAPELMGMDVLDLQTLDMKLVSLDPSVRRERLGGNSILSVSLAAARAASASRSLPLYEYIRQAYGFQEKIEYLPKPMIVVMEGGRHAVNSTDLQEYMIAILARPNSREAIRAGIEIYHALGKILKAEGYDINVGLEGAYAPTSIPSNTEPLIHIQKAIGEAGYSSVKEVGLAIDPAASEIYKDGYYHFARENRKLTADQLIEYYQQLVNKFGVMSIEDGLEEDDWANWSRLNSQIGEEVMIVGDDLTVTQVSRLQRAIDLKAINSILIKPNQVGTLTETIDTIRLANQEGLKTIISHRGGGETTDTLIIDLAVATRSDFVKVGPSRGERVVKYNRMMEIEEDLKL